MLVMTFASEIGSSSGSGALILDRPSGKRPEKRGVGGDFPPINWDDFGGGGGDDDEEPGEGFGESRKRHGQHVAEFGLGLGLAAIGSLFLVFLGAYFSLAYWSEDWPPAQLATAPAGLWVSTGMLIASSLCVAKAVRTREESGVMLWLSATLLFGILFLLAQVQVWHAMHTSGLLPSTNGYGAMFYTLTGLHGTHVLAGLAYVTTLLLRVRNSSSPRISPTTVRLCGVYWHFIGAIWLVLFCVL